MTATHGLDLGSLDLVAGLASDDGYTLHVLGDGATFGASQAQVREIVSMLADGNLVTYDRAGNREVSFDVLIEGADAVALQAGEVALRRELYRPNTVTWTPPGVFGAPTVFEVVTSEMAPQFNDIDEWRGRRTFRVTLTCAPFARSVDLTTVEALSAPAPVPTNISINSADVTTGWTGFINESGLRGDLVEDMGANMRVLALGTTGSFRVRSAGINFASAPVSLTSTPHLAVEVAVCTDLNRPSTTTFRAIINGAWQVLTPALTRATANGTEYLFNATPGTFSGLSVTVDYSVPSGGLTEIRVHNVAATDTLTQVSARQVTRLIEVGGTERTPASLHAFTSSGFLGNTILHTTPYANTAYHPALSRRRLSGNTGVSNVSTRKITGTWEPLQPNPLIARISSEELPRGDYVLMAAVKSSATGERAISYAVKSMLVGTVVGNTTGTAYYNFAVADRLEYVPIAVVSAPVVRDAGVLDVEVHLSNPSPGLTTLHAEEWWMFTDGPDSALSIIGTDEGELWVDSPDVTSPVPRVWVGNSLGQKFHPNTRLIAQGDHKFTPGTVQVTTISDANDYLEVDLSYYKRWHSNAAE